MTLITRITRLFKADIHGILDCLEDPRAVLKQAIREMEAEIEQKRSTLEEFSQRHANLVRQREERQKFLEESERHIELSFQADDEVLARASVRKRLETERRLKALTQAIEKLESDHQRLVQKIQTEQEQLEDIREKTELLSNTTTESASDLGENIEQALSGLNSAVTEDEVELAFLNEKQKRRNQTAA